MTRINSAIDPRNLTDQHLIAELRELPRIFTAVNKRSEQGKSFDDIPKEFCLGSGHCKFFYDKIEFLLRRHQKLRSEYTSRTTHLYHFEVERLDKIPVELFKNHKPTQKEIQLLIERISMRIKESNQIPRYCGKPITKIQAVRLLMYGQIGEDLSCLDNDNFEVIAFESLIK